MVNRKGISTKHGKMTSHRAKQQVTGRGKWPTWYWESKISWITFQSFIGHRRLSMCGPCFPVTTKNHWSFSQIGSLLSHPSWVKPRYSHLWFQWGATTKAHPAWLKCDMAGRSWMRLCLDWYSRSRFHRSRILLSNCAFACNAGQDCGFQFSSFQWKIALRIIVNTKGKESGKNELS